MPCFNSNYSPHVLVIAGALEMVFYEAIHPSTSVLFQGS